MPQGRCARVSIDRRRGILNSTGRPTRGRLGEERRTSVIRVQHPHHAARCLYYSTNRKHNAALALMATEQAPRNPRAGNVLLKPRELVERSSLALPIVGTSPRHVPSTKQRRTNHKHPQNRTARHCRLRSPTGPNRSPITVALNSAFPALRSMRAKTFGYECEFTNCFARPALIVAGLDSSASQTACNVCFRGTADIKRTNAGKRPSKPTGQPPMFLT